jgi:hypothetical protein
MGEAAARRLLHAQVEHRGRVLTLPVVLLLNRHDAEALAKAKCREQLLEELMSKLRAHLGELLPEVGGPVAPQAVAPKGGKAAAKAAVSEVTLSSASFTFHVEVRPQLELEYCVLEEKGGGALRGTGSLAKSELRVTATLRAAQAERTQAALQSDKTTLHSHFAAKG